MLRRESESTGHWQTPELTWARLRQVTDVAMKATFAWRMTWCVECRSPSESFDDAPVEMTVPGVLLERPVTVKAKKARATPKLPTCEVSPATPTRLPWLSMLLEHC